MRANTFLLLYNTALPARLSTAYLRRFLSIIAIWIAAATSCSPPMIRIAKEKLPLHISVHIVSKKVMASPSRAYGKADPARRINPLRIRRKV